MKKKSLLMVLVAAIAMTLIVWVIDASLPKYLIIYYIGLFVGIWMEKVN